MEDSTSQSSPGDAHGDEPVLRPGMIVAERYRVIDRLGSGGMAHVYRATQLRLNRDVALKILRREYSETAMHRERFLQEAQSASRIRHPNVVEIIDFGTLPDGCAFMVMEFLEGEPLDVLLKREGRLSWGRICDLVSQVTRGLAATHARGIVHRDIKPPNCILTRADDGTEVVKIVDFGIAKVTKADTSGSLPTVTRSGVIFGTASYMAPEQANGLAVDGRTDVYAVGVMLFELACGRLPFVGDSFMQVARQQVWEPPPRLHAVCAEVEVPAAAERLIMRALEKEPARRQRDMVELERELLASVPAAGGESSSGAHPPVAQTEVLVVDRASPRRSHRLSRGLATAVVGLVAVGVVWWLVAHPRPSVSSSTADEPVSVRSADVVRTRGRPPEDRSRAISVVASEADDRVDNIPASRDSGTHGGDEASTVIDAIEPEETDVSTSDEPVDERVTRAASSGGRSTSKAAPPTSPRRPAVNESSVANAKSNAGASAKLTDTQIGQGLNAVQSGLTQCRLTHGGIPGLGIRVQLTIVDGRVIQARVLEDRAGTPLGDCVAAVLRTAEFSLGKPRLVTRVVRL